MLVFLAISLAVTTVSAQYGSGPSNDPPASYSNNIYYPPAVYDSNYWDYDSHEHRKHCPKLRTFAGEFPGIPEEAFYPPVIRYVKDHGKLKAMIVCDRSPKNINFLFGRYNKTLDIRSAHFVAMGSTAAALFKCNRDERRFEGSVIDLDDVGVPGGDFSKTVEITQFTCLGIDKTVIGIFGEIGIKQLALNIGGEMDEVFGPATRKKREIGDEKSGTTDTPAVTQAITDSKVTSKLEESPVVTESVVQDTEGPSEAETPAPGSVEAVKAAFGKLGEIFG